VSISNAASARCNIINFNSIDSQYFVCTMLLRLKIQPHKVRKFAKVAENAATLSECYSRLLWLKIQPHKFRKFAKVAEDVAL